MTQKTTTIRISGLAYLVIGVLVYIVLGDYTVLSWADPWIAVYAVFWPIVLILKALLWILIIAAIFGVVWITWEWFENRKRICMQKRIHKQRFGKKSS